MDGRTNGVRCLFADRKRDPGLEIALRHRLAAVDAQPSWVTEQSEALLGAQKLGRWK